MELSDSPQFTVEAIRRHSEAGAAALVGRLSHLLGVRDTTACLFRSATGSQLGTIKCVPASANETIEYETQDLAPAPEFRVDATHPWIDGTCQAYQVAMILAGHWAPRTFTSEPARYSRLGGAIGFQPGDVPLLEGAEDLGNRDGAWDHEHCAVCNARIAQGGDATGLVDANDHWLCRKCYDRCGALREVSFVAKA